VVRVRGQGGAGTDQRAEVGVQCSLPGWCGGIGAGHLDEALSFGPGGEDVPGEIAEGSMAELQSNQEVVDAYLGGGGG
jgi:Branched-chain amino acid ATP-binding cassette transporter